MESKLINSGFGRNTITNLWFKCLIELQDIIA